MSEGITVGATVYSTVIPTTSSSSGVVGTGVVRFIGEAQFRPGITWVGIELKDPLG